MTWQNISTSRRVQQLRGVLGKEGHGKGWICSTSCKILYWGGSGEEDFKRAITRFIAFMQHDNDNGEHDDEDSGL